ncbi:MAG TPA: hypothetical protein VIF83_06125 [Gemmatimonadaceae bacterium]|jgi:hypothetical protein
MTQGSGIDEAGVAALQNQISELRQMIGDMDRRSEDVTAILIALFAQHGDPTHVTIERAAELRGWSVKTIRRRIDAGEFTLEVIPGTRESGIPIEQIYARWIPIAVARQSLRKIRERGKTVGAVHVTPLSRGQKARS